jgi:hypothetical protein
VDLDIYILDVHVHAFQFGQYQKYEFSLKFQAPVRVVCENGTELIADHVICTVSLGVLKEKHNTLFKPCLSEKKQNAIKV